MNTRRTWLPEEEKALMQIWYSNRFLHARNTFQKNRDLSFNKSKHFLYDAATRLLNKVADLDVTSNQIKEKIRNVERKFQDRAEAVEPTSSDPFDPYFLYWTRVHKQYTPVANSHEDIDHRQVPDKEIFFKRAKCQKQKKIKNPVFQLPALPQLQPVVESPQLPTPVAPPVTSEPMASPTKAKLVEFLSKYQNFDYWLGLIYDPTDDMHKQLKSKLFDLGITNLRGIYFAEAFQFAVFPKHVQNMIAASLELQLE